MSPPSTALPHGWSALAVPGGGGTVPGPGGELVRVIGPGGVTGLAVRFRADLADHPLLQADVDEAERLLVAPGVPGVLPLVARDRERAVFVYPTGDGRLLAELLARCADRGVAPGERVAIELLARCGALLDLAWGAGATAGVPNHGGLNPWRIVVYPDGDVAILGYGLAAVEVIAWLDGDTDATPGVGFRYCPPERIQDAAEDGRADLYSLGMVAAELALGRALLTGDGQEMVDHILSDGVASPLDASSEPVRDLIRSTLAVMPADRPLTGSAVSAAARTLLHTLSGRTLSGLTRGDLDERVEATRPAAAPSRKPAPGLPSGGPTLGHAVRTRTLLPEEDRGEAPTEPTSELPPAPPTRTPAPAEPRHAFAEGPRVEVLAETPEPAPAVVTGTPGPIPEPLAAEPEPAEIAPVASPGEPAPDASLSAEPPSVGVIGPEIEQGLGPDEVTDDTAEDDEDWVVAYDRDEGDEGVRPPADVDYGPEILSDVPEVLYLRAVTVDLASQQILLRDGEPVRLSETQCAVLAYLAARPNRDVSREELFLYALGGQGSPESVRGLVARLRKKIEQDPSQPDHIVNVYGVGYRFVPPEDPHAVGPDPLPEPNAALAGRDEEIAEAQGALARAQLVSVVGPPGSGAIQVALRAARALHDAGWEVHRCLVGGGEAVSTTLARGLGVRRIGRKRNEVLEEITELLATREDLLVYLEAPHPHATLRSTVAGLLEGSRAKILVGCRSPLELPGEYCIRLASLSEDAAVALFRERVAQVRPGTLIDDDVASAIVEHLDHMPAALEAAAARTEFIAPDALLARLQGGGGSSEAGLDTDLGASIERLDPAERAAVEQCVVFRDGFDLAAAEAVVRLPRASRGMVTILESLVAHSLLRDEENVRWSVYETVRSHVRQLVDPDILEETQARHAVYYGTLGAKLGGRPWVERAELSGILRERENLLCVLHRGGPPAAGAALALTAILGHEPAGPLCEAVDRVLVDRDVAGAPAGDARKWQIAAQLASARLNLYLGQAQKARAALRAATSDGQLHEAPLLAEVARIQAELGSTSEAEAALARLTTADPWCLAVTATLRGRILAAKADPKRAERAFVEALHGFASLDADIGTAHAQRSFAELRAAMGQARRAVALLEDAIVVFDDVGDRLAGAQCRMRLAELLVGTGGAEDAAGHLERVIGSARELSAGGLLALGRGVLGAVRAMQRDWESAERLFFLAMSGSAPDHGRIQSLFALTQLLKGDADTAHEEAKGALPHPIATAVVAALERQPAPHADDEAYLLWQALEAWRAGASTTRIESELGDRASVPVRMVLACPRERPKRATA